MSGPVVSTTGLRSSATAATTLPKVQWAIGAGTADVITAAFSPAVTAITDGMVLGVRVSATNTSKTPTFNPDGTGAHTITKQYGEALEPGDMPSEPLFRYNATSTTWVLVNPSPQWREVTEWAAAGGSADAITATYTPAHGTLHDGQVFSVRAGAANATTAPTFAPDTQTARIIYKFGKQPLVAGDIYGANHEINLRYHVDATPWYELMNPQFVVDTSFGALSQILTADEAAGGNSTSAQPWFPTKKAVTVKVGTYEFVGYLHLSRAAGVASHTFGPNFSLGSASVGQINYVVETNTNDDASLGPLNALPVDVQTVVIAKAASTSATEQIIMKVRGTVTFTVAGTFEPGFQYGTSAPGGAPTAKKGSHFIMRPVGTLQGTWA